MVILEEEIKMKDYAIWCNGKEHRVKAIAAVYAASIFFLDYPSYGKEEEYHCYYTGYSQTIFLTLKTVKTVLWKVYYAFQMKEIYAETLSEVLVILARTEFPELGNSAQFIIDVRERGDGKVNEVEIYLKAGGTKKPNKIIGLPIPSPETMFNGYEAMLGLSAEMVLDEAIRVKRIEDLRGLIEESLASGNKEDFMKYSAELNGVNKSYA
jgi:hypothetical protein